jgi:hypothetical protein
MGFLFATIIMKFPPVGYNSKYPETRIQEPEEKQGRSIF